MQLAKKHGVLLSNRAEYEEAFKLFLKQLLRKAAPRPLTRTQTEYLDVLDDWMSLQDLAKQFNCTPQNALKMVRALEERGLISKTSLFKRRSLEDRGAWAWYYRRNFRPEKSRRLQSSESKSISRTKSKSI
jgi:predicted transcriptional regulator